MRDSFGRVFYTQQEVTWFTLPPPSSMLSITTMTTSTGAFHIILCIAFEVLISERSHTGHSFGCCVTWMFAQVYSRLWVDYWSQLPYIWPFTQWCYNGCFWRGNELCRHIRNHNVSSLDLIDVSFHLWTTSLTAARCRRLHDDCIS